VNKQYDLVIKMKSSEPGMVVHTCNPSYSEGTDQEDCGLKPSLANSSRDPISIKPFTKKRLVEWLKE
jgi:hypothetical protein